MGLRLRSLPVLLFLGWFFVSMRLVFVRAQSPGSAVDDARSLDALLQDYAYRAFHRPRTGIVYDGNAPSNMTGIKVSAMRLRSGSLWKWGVKMYKEFEIPTGVLGQPYVKRLVLVYQNLGNWSSVYYPLSGYVYLAPVLGLLAYDASNLSATNLPELSIRPSGQPISIRFPDVNPPPGGSVAKCVSFDLSGSVNFSNVLSDNVCVTFQQGHFSIVVESTAPSPAPLAPIPPSLAPPGEAPTQPPMPSKRNKNNSKVWVVVGSVLGGTALFLLLGLLLVWAGKYKRKKKMQQMERAADVGEPLQMTTVGSTKAPAATVTRTQPNIETEYVA